MAFQQLLEKFPLIEEWEQRTVYVYDALTNEEAELVGAQHQLDSQTVHSFTTAEKVC